jgi:hypothetical protein
MNGLFRKHAISLMKENNIKELTFIGDNGDWLVEDVPYILCDMKEGILDMAVSKVVLTDDDTLKFIVNDNGSTYTFDEYDPLNDSEENVYATIIEDINKELGK